MMSRESCQIIVISLKEEFYSRADALLGVYSSVYTHPHCITSISSLMVHVCRSGVFFFFFNLMHNTERVSIAYFLRCPCYQIRAFTLHAEAVRQRGAEQKQQCCQRFTAKSIFAVPLALNLSHSALFLFKIP